jgi:hypothetical protein
MSYGKIVYSTDRKIPFDGIRNEMNLGSKSAYFRVFWSVDHIFGQKSG